VVLWGGKEDALGGITLLDVIIGRTLESEDVVQYQIQLVRVVIHLGLMHT
jgi:hypothetical protein